MIVPYKLLETVILAEILLVVLIIILTYALKYYFYLRVRNDERTSEQIELYLMSAAAGNTKITESAFRRSWRRLDILLPLIYKLDTTIKSPAWYEVKQSVVRIILLPIARKKYNSRIWMNRLLSAQTFEISMEKEDEETVAILLEDKIPLIHLHAAIAAIKCSSITMINLVINNMSKQRRLGQTVYLKIFNQSQPQTWQYVESRLNTEKDPFIRATCYKILLTLSHYTESLDASADIHANNLELRLAAIRYTAAAQKQHAIPVFTDLLSDKNWEIRATCTRLLGDLHATESIEEITHGLKDPIWWVRLNAANTLKSFGDIGISVLEEQDPKKDKYAYETARHVLDKLSS